MVFFFLFVVCAPFARKARETETSDQRNAGYARSGLGEGTDITEETPDFVVAVQRDRGWAAGMIAKIVSCLASRQQRRDTDGTISTMVYEMH